MIVDVLAIGAHPDDVELGVGGMLYHFAQREYKTGILDLTRGEMGTRGSVEERAAEAAAAAALLDVAVRENAGLPDGALENTPAQRRAIVPFIRRLQPKIILAPMKPDRHPDHEAAHDLARDANWIAGVKKIESDYPPHRTPQLYFYNPYFESGDPTFIVDISDAMEVKLAAMRAYGSQFYNPDYDGDETMIASKAFWDGLIGRAAYWGSRIGVAYGEPLFSIDPIAVKFLPGLDYT